MKRTSRSVALLILLTCLWVIAGCGGSTGATSTTPPPGATASPNARAQACQALTSVGTSLDSLSQIGDNTTVGELKAKQQKLATGIDTLSGAVSKIPGASGALVDQLKSVSDQLEATLQGMPDSATVGQVSSKLQNLDVKVSSAQQVQSKLVSALKCS